MTKLSKFEQTITMIEANFVIAFNCILTFKKTHVGIVLASLEVWYLFLLLS